MDAAVSAKILYPIFNSAQVFLFIFLVTDSYHKDVSDIFLFQF